MNIRMIFPIVHANTFLQYLLHSDLVIYLHNNIDEFPTYAEFNGYNEGEPTSHRDNKGKKTFWA